MTSSHVLQSNVIMNIYYRQMRTAHSDVVLAYDLYYSTVLRENGGLYWIVIVIGWVIFSHK